MASTHDYIDVEKIERNADRYRKVKRQRTVKKNKLWKLCKEFIKEIEEEQTFIYEVENTQKANVYEFMTKILEIVK